MGITWIFCSVSVPPAESNVRIPVRTPSRLVHFMPLTYGEEPLDLTDQHRYHKPDL